MHWIRSSYQTACHTSSRYELNGVDVVAESVFGSVENAFRDLGDCFFGSFQSAERLFTRLFISSM